MPIDPKLREALSATDALQKTTLERLFDAEATYSERAERLEEAVSTAMAERYLKPEHNRHDIIKEGATRVRARIKEFDRIRVQIFVNIANVRMNLQLSALSLHLSAISPVFRLPAVTVTKTEDLLPQLTAFHAALRDAGANLTLTAAKAIFVGEKVAKAQQSAANLITVRQSELERFTTTEISADLDEVVAASQEILNSQVREALAEETLKAILGAAFETAVPFLKLATMGYDLGKKIREINQRYMRNDVDEMFQHAEVLDEQNQAAQKVLDYLDALAVSMAEFATREAAISPTA